ncbi:hypothetical protein OIU84_008908 [Salix udensis]|uniref:Uncharacterized protein n=1 Tax=Salix udensis TaxID=889485 RepID=A0AAD6NXU1_9ROSI|nr:hypothetical protein OIU84_008908 [Salix udensis]
MKASICIQGMRNNIKQESRLHAALVSKSVKSQIPVVSKQST